MISPTTSTPPADIEFAADIADLCVTVVDGHVEDGWGSFDPETRVITLLPILGAVQRRSVLARMLGHAFHDHTSMGDAEEAEARAWAVRRLITTEQVTATLKAVDWAQVFSREFDVLPSDMTAYFTGMTAEQRVDIMAALVLTPEHQDPR